MPSDCYYENDGAHNRVKTETFPLCENRGGRDKFIRFCSDVVFFGGVLRDTRFTGM